MGLATDGGLLVPMAIPTIPKDALKDWSTMTFPELAFHVMSCFVKEDEISPNNLKGIIDRSYNNGKWRDKSVTPVKQMKSQRTTCYQIRP